MNFDYVLIKGAGDLASGVACVFREAGYRVVMSEIEQPTCVRRMVSFAEAVYEGEICIEGVWGRLADSFDKAMQIVDRGEIAVIVDPRGEKTLQKYRPSVFIDAAMIKKNMGTSLNDSDVVIALGPGFEAGSDVHAVIETKRGPALGQPIYKGMATPDTGIPGNKLGYTRERLLRAPADGRFDTKLKIGDIVKKGQVVAMVGSHPVRAQIAGVIRGLLKDGLMVNQGIKAGDIHPEEKPQVCFSVTDKAWTIGRGALEAVRVLSGTQAYN
ncbi:selenium-dependent molybdenum cofactor biosynthesis protein YqeB [Desulfoscipio sp. XC116]|uniref:selenium-dependent molybdenum cofactor biosynthesis protein YqeB n=1 Tax=Desulfoscipio sp. XC116 TaxID=3144975 RepID=UPI00325C0070